MAYTVTISEQVEGTSVVVSYHKDELPAHETKSFETVEDALASEPTLDWTEVTDELREDEEIDGDVLYLAYFN